MYYKSIVPSLISLACVAALAQQGERQTYDLSVDARDATWMQWEPGSGGPPDIIVATGDFLRLLDGTPSGDFVVSREAVTSGPDVRAVAEVDSRGQGMPNHFIAVVAGSGTTGTIESFSREGGITGAGPVLTVAASQQWVNVRTDAFTRNGDIYEDAAVLIDDLLTVADGSPAGIVQGPTLTLPGPGVALATGDTDGDGLGEIFVSIPSLAEIAIVTNTGGTLSLGVPIAVSLPVQGLATADLNGDGLADLVYTDGTGLTMLRSTGTGFVPYQTLGEPIPGGGAGALASGQLDADTPPELILAIDGGLVPVDSAAGTYGYQRYWGGGPPQRTQIVMDGQTWNVAGTGGTTVDVYVTDPAGSHVPSGDAIISGRGAGSSQPPELIITDDQGVPLMSPLLAYGAGGYGITVGSADIRSEQVPAIEEILTGPGPGPIFGPQVRAWQSTGLPIAKVNYYAYGSLRFGVNVAGGDLDPDAFDEIVTGAGPGEVFGPHVRGWNFDSRALTPIAKVNFFAYGSLHFGVNVAGGDTDGDGSGELLTAPGPGPTFAPQIREFAVGKDTTPGPAWTAFSALGYGAQVCAADIDADGSDEVFAADGPGGKSTYVPRFKGFTLWPVGLLPSFDVAPALAGIYGGRIGSATLPFGPTLLTASGPDPAAPDQVIPIRYIGAQPALDPSLAPFGGTAIYGVSVAGGPTF